MAIQRFFSAFRQLGIRTKLIIYYTVFAIVTVGAVIYFAYTEAIHSLQTTVENQLNTIAELKRDSLNQWVDEQQRDASLLVNLPELRSLSEELLDPASSFLGRESARRRLTNLVDIVVQHKTDFQDIQILDTNGQIVVSAIPRLVGVSQAEQLFFTQGLRGKFTQSFYHSNVFSNSILTIAMPLLDHSQKSVGVLALHLNMNRVEQILREGQVSTGEAVNTYLIDLNHAAVTNNLHLLPPQQPLQSFAIDHALINEERGSSAYVSHTGVEVFGAYLWMEDQKAALIVEIDREVALQPARRLAANIAIVGFQISVLLLIAVLIVSEHITAPLRALSETVSRISGGQLNASAPVLANDEVGALARAFNSMTEQLGKTLDGLQTELTERKQVESDLLQFRTVMDESNDAIFLIDPETGRCIDFNKSAYEFLGYTREELERMSIIDIAEYVTSLEDWHERIDLIHETGSLIFETVYRRKNYTTFPVEISSRMLYYGGRTLLLFVARDITRRKQSEREVRESEERFRKVFQSSPVAIAITTLEEGRLLDANYAYWDLTGYVAEEVLGRDARELKLWEDIRARAEFVEDLKRKGSLFNPDDHFQHTDGTLKYVISFHELIRIGHEDCVLSMFYDMSAQKQMMQALQQSEARIRALVDAFPDTIMELALDGTIINMVPPKGTELPVMPTDRFIGKRIENIFDQSIAAQISMAIQHVIEKNQISVFEFETVISGVAHAMEARLTASAADTVLVMIRDFTQRKWAEQEREKLISELENKNAELERFTYTVSHDLKSPLFTIRGFLGYLEQDALSGNTERLKGDIQRIINATDKMQRLLNELLELSRIGRLKNESTYIRFNDLAAEALELVQGRLMERKIAVHIQANLPQVYGDRPRLVEVLQNLLDNAAKFMGDQKQPCIEIGQAGTEVNKPVFYVRDNGMGIAPEHHDRVFGLFNKLDPRSDGTGVGLALVRRILEVHGSRIWIESEAGKGSTFFFTLPASDAPAT